MRKDGTSSPSATKGRSFAPPPTPSQAFPKSRRLLKRSEFQRVYEQGFRVARSSFVLWCRPSGEERLGRAGLTVSRKIGDAVVRNRVKRLLREAIRRSWDDFPVGCEAVLQARVPVREIRAAALEVEVQRALKEAARRMEAKRSAGPTAAG